MREPDVRDPSAVTVIIPAYRPDHRFVRTLASLQAQTHPALWVNVSVDPAPGHAMPALPDIPRLTIIEQPIRRGWVGNTNALLPTVKTPLFLALSHDDTLTPEYLEKCVPALLADPEAMVAHGGYRQHGIGPRELSTSSINGPRRERIKTFIDRQPHLAELGWRGVVRSELIARGLRLRTRRSDGHLSNTLWALELLFHGTSIDVPGVFYDRHVEADGLSREFHRRTLAERSVMLADNAACVLDAVNEARLPPDEAELAVVGWMSWLLDLQGNWNVLADELRSDQRTFSELHSAIARFVANVALSLTASPPRAL